MEETKTEEPKKIDDIITVNGGVEIDAKLLAGGIEKVKIGQIKISSIQRFYSVLGNEAESIELYCGKPKGWADTLTIESASEIADKGMEINLPFFKAWCVRQTKWREATTPGYIKDLERKLDSAIANVKASALANSAQVSPTTTS